MHIPNKFADLVGMIEKRYTKPPVVESDEDMWNHFCKAALSGGERSVADVNYMHHLLEEEGLLYRESLKDEWVRYTLEFLQDAKDDVDPDQPNLKGKVKAIEKVEAEIDNICMLLKNADDMFDLIGIDTEFLQKIAGNTEEEKELIGKITSYSENAIVKKSLRSRHPARIWGLTYSKAVFWLNNCGIALQFIPNDEFSMKFMRELEKNWQSKDFFDVNDKFEEFCERISADPYYAGLALWYFEATRKLTTRKNARYYSPLKLMNIMKNNDMDIEDLRVSLEDIENWEYLKEVFKSDPKF